MVLLTSSVILDFFFRVRDTSLCRTLFFLWLSERGVWRYSEKRELQEKEARRAFTETKNVQTTQEATPTLL